MGLVKINSEGWKRGDRGPVVWWWILVLPVREKPCN